MSAALAPPAALTVQDAVSELRVALAGVVEESVTVACTEQDWRALGIPDHMPTDVALVRLGALEEALWRLAEAALAAKGAVALAERCVYGRTAGNGQEEQSGGED